MGLKIVLRALTSPLRQIATSSGVDAATGKQGDMLELGLLDPAKVSRSAL